MADHATDEPVGTRAHGHRAGPRAAGPTKGNSELGSKLSAAAPVPPSCTVCVEPLTLLSLNVSVPVTFVRTVGV